MTVRILLVDDHPVVRSGLRLLLGTIEGVEVVGEAGDGSAAVRDCCLLHPDVVLMDLTMPVMGGIEATRRIRAAQPDVAVLILTMSDDDDTLRTALRAGAGGYLLKEAGQEDIMAAIRAVSTGQTVLGAGLAERMLAAGEAAPILPQLTSREREILGLVVAGVLLRRTTGWSAVAVGAAGLFLVIGAVAGTSDRQTSAMVLAGALLAVAIVFFPRRESWPVGRTPDGLVQLLLVGSITVMMIIALVLGPPGLVAAAWIWCGCVVGWVWWVIDRRPGPDRRSMVWLAGALGVVGIAWAIVAFIVPGQLSAAVAVLCWWVLPGAMIVASSRTAADPRRALVQLVVLLVASVAYLAGYTALTAVIELTVGPPTAGQTTAVALSVALTMPLLVRVLRAGVAVLVLGRRADPWRTAAGILDRIDRGPQAALSVVATTAQLPFLRLDLDGRAVAVAGAPLGPTVALDLDVDDHSTQLVIGLREGEPGLGSDDRRLLRMITPLLSEIVRSELLAAELQTAREQTATARAEERRQLRRDLHDGLGPRLSGLVYAVDASRNLVHSNPAAAGEVLVGLRADIVAAVEEVRRLSYGMRPAVLDDLGLVDALRLQADRLAGDRALPLEVAISAHGLPARIPAAVEVAAYRIVVESLSNVMRHSAAERATVELTADGGGLVVEVCDGDGGGGTDVPQRWHAGVGLESMRARAEELGGSLMAGPSGRGGRVSASLPWPPSEV